MTLPTHASPGEAVSDEVLVVAAGNGDVAAFEELYRRHHVVATRLAVRVTGNEEDARDAVAEAFIKVFGVVSSRGLRHRASFRAYLLTAVRRVAIDKVRQRWRTESVEEIDAFDAASPRQGPADSVVRSEEERLLVEAFKDLPQRSRSVLWLVDVERRSAQEAASALGLTPNNVTQIAVRARGRLRHGYIRAHLGGPVDAGCRFTVDHLGAYLDGGLRPVSLVKVDGHLDGCTPCQGRLEQLRSAGLVTRRTLLPLLVFRRVLDGFRRPRESSGSGVAGAETLAAQPPGLTGPLISVASNPTVVDVVQTLGQSPVVQRVVAAVAVGTMTVGASSLAYRSSGDVAGAATPPPGASVEVAASSGPPHPAVAAATPGGSGPLAPASAAPPVTGAVADPGAPPSVDVSVVGTLQSLSTALAAAGDVPVVRPASTAPSTVPLPASPPVSLPALVAPPLDAPLVALPPTTVQSVGPAVPLSGPPPITTPSLNSAPLTTPPVTVSPLSTPPLPSVNASGPSTPALPLATPSLTIPPVTTSTPGTPPVTTPPLSTPPLPPLSAAPVPPSAVGIAPVTTPPLTTAPVTTPTLGTPPLATPPLNAPALPPLPTPTVGTPPVTTPPVTAALATPPVTSPPLTTPPVTTALGPAATTPPLTAPPVTTAALATPPVTTPPLTTPPVTTALGSPAAATPPLTTPPVTSAVTSAVTTPPLTTPPVSTPPLGGGALGLAPVRALP
ncbi:MAG TPA: sigma-70 family RNA polymerase sigma factor [Acidimicrobiales bacterium]|nr:sigma-70 family RNA polymerase sigma factor [Acidimicrobiales bacterium]